jgi:predicted DNA-binding transcriptional regulator
MAVKELINEDYQGYILIQVSGAKTLEKWKRDLDKAFEQPKQGQKETFPIQFPALMFCDFPLWL